MNSIARDARKQWAGKDVAKDVKLHEAIWQDCVACPLAGCRKRPVLWRGHLPADVVFIGEAPGEAEDVLGIPFAGSTILDEIIDEAWQELPPRLKTLRFAMTNSVACKPTEQLVNSAGQIRKPKAAEVKACLPRLNALLKIANPGLVILVGKVAVAVRDAIDVPTAAIVHPDALQRMNDAQYALGFKRAFKTLGNALTSTFHIPSRKPRKP